MFLDSDVTPVMEVAAIAIALQIYTALPIMPCTVLAGL